MADDPAVPQARITTLTELPPPSGPLARGSAAELDEGWQRFVDYALAQRAAPAGGGQGRSALLQSGSSLAAPERRPCRAPDPAVIIDLDREDRPFDPANAAPVPAALAAALQRLRDAGVTVAWIAQLPAARAAEVSAALRATGLDPAGRDPLLLLRTAEDRKQLLREDTNRDVCVIALAGDLRGDFDELFDYLRNPAGAAALYPMMGSGWFLVPPLPGTAEASSAQP